MMERQTCWPQIPVREISCRFDSCYLYHAGVVEFGIHSGLKPRRLRACRFNSCHQHLTRPIGQPSNNGDRRYLASKLGGYGRPGVWRAAMSACLSVLKTVMTVIPLYRFEPCAFRLRALTGRSVVDRRKRGLVTCKTRSEASALSPLHAPLVKRISHRSSEPRLLVRIEWGVPFMRLESEG